MLVGVCVVRIVSVIVAVRVDVDGLGETAMVSVTVAGKGTAAQDCVTVQYTARRYSRAPLA